jgi:hypothetical protein
VRAGTVSHHYVLQTVAMAIQQIREDRILHEALATGGDVRRLCDLSAYPWPPPDAAARSDGLSVVSCRASRCASTADRNASARGRIPQAVQELNDVGDVQDGGSSASTSPPASIRATRSSADFRAWRVDVSSASRKILDQDSLSMLGHAQSSPMVSGAMVWKAERNRRADRRRAGCRCVQ